MLVKLLAPLVGVPYLGWQALRLVVTLAGRRLYCELVGHHRIVDRRFDGPIGGFVEIVGCGHCTCQWVVTDQATVRYDNDPLARAEILRTYPNLSAADLAVSYSD